LGFTSRFFERVDEARFLVLFVQNQGLAVGTPRAFNGIAQQPDRLCAR
jgi:hypothetical protein